MWKNASACVFLLLGLTAVVVRCTPANATLLVKYSDASGGGVDDGSASGDGVDDGSASGDGVDGGSGDDSLVVALLDANETAEDSGLAPFAGNASTANVDDERIDFKHPARTIRIMYVHSRDKINTWMDDPLMHSFVIPATIGACSGVLVVVLFFLVSACVTRDRRRKKRTVVVRSMPNLLEDRKHLIDGKQSSDDTDNTAIV